MLHWLKTVVEVTTDVVEAYARSSARVASELQLVLLHRAGLRQFDVLRHPIPDSVVNDFWSETLPAEIGAALDNFRQGGMDEARSRRYAAVYGSSSEVGCQRNFPPRPFCGSSGSLPRLSGCAAII